MSRQHHPGEDNILSLRQGLTLIDRLDDSTYAGDPEDRSGVGCQFRHCIDFYECFLRGIEAGRVDYSARQRDRRVEVDRGHATRRIESIIAALVELDPGVLDVELQVRLERTHAEPGDREWCRSSVLRELQFLFSHTIHHYALIANLLVLQGVELDRDVAGFGVAPSTLDYWKQAEGPGH